jgi:hypothetical protein
MGMANARRLPNTDIVADHMGNAEGIGGSAAHDARREGTVTPREHNLKRSAGTKSPREAKLEDPNLPHGEPSKRERRRAKQRGKE